MVSRIHRYFQRLMAKETGYTPCDYCGWHMPNEALAEDEGMGLYCKDRKGCRRRLKYYEPPRRRHE